MVLETPRLTLRPWKEAEIPFLAALLSDPETMKHWPFLYTPEQARDWFDRAAKAWAEHRIGRWAVVRSSDNEILGDCGLMPSAVEGEAVTDLGYILHAAHHGQGYGTEAARSLLRYGRETLGLKNIVVHMADDNAASIRVAEKLGLNLDRHFVNARNQGKRHLLFRPQP